MSLKKLGQNGTSKWCKAFLPIHYMSRISYIFSRDLSLFSRDFTYVHWNIPTCSPIRIFIFGRRYVPILNTFLQFFFKNRSFGSVEPQEGLEIVPDILTQFFLEIRILTATGAGLDQPCFAGLGQAKMARFFQLAVTVAFPGVLDVTEKRRWKKVDFWSSHAVAIGVGRSMKVLITFSIPVSFDGSRGAGGPQPARRSHIRPNNKNSDKG
jgi:hypothetical protein